MVSFRIDDEITLREFERGDAEAVYSAAIANYDHLVRFMDWIGPDYSLRSAEEFVERSISGWGERKNLALGIFRDDRFIGSIGFVNFDWTVRKTEIGYWLSRDEEGKGIVTFACRRLIEFAIRDLALNRIEIRCSAENKRSSAIPKRMGFKREGVLREAESRGGRLHDFEIYGLLASDWKKQNSNL